MSTARAALAIAAFTLATTAAVVRAEAANTPKIKNIRIREVCTRLSSCSYRLEVAATGDATADSWVAVETDQGRTFTLEPEPLARRASVVAYVGEPGPKGLTVRLDLKDAGGKPLFSGSTSIPRGRWDGAYEDGKGPGFWVGRVQLLPTGKPGVYAVAVSITGEGAADIAAGTIVTETVDEGGKPVEGVTPLDGSAFTDERTFSTTVRFDGDPVGSSYGLDGSLFAPRVKHPAKSERLDRVRETVEMIEIPTGPCGGPVLRVSGNGTGTRNTASNTSQTQQAQLL